MLATFAALVVALSLALGILRRFGEVHHGFFGIVAFSGGLILGHPWMQWVGLVLLADDTLQHTVEAFAVLARRPVPNDFTPIHQFGSWLIVKAEYVWWGLLAWWHHDLL